MENIFDNLLSLKEASNMWHLEESTLRKAINSKRFILNKEVKKFGKQWVITKNAMERVHGYLEYNKEEKEYDESKKRQIYYYISECFVGYCKKYNINKNTANNDFNKYQIIDYIYDCYDYLHLQNVNSTIKDIASRIRRGINYD